MRLVKEEHQLRLFGIADFRKLFKEFGEQPQHERRVQKRTLIQLCTMENIDVAASVFVGLHPVVQIDLRLAEKQRAARVFQFQKRALDRACGLL